MLLKDFDIVSVLTSVGDKHKTGIVERFNRTLGEMIQKYRTLYNTTRYIDVLDDLVKNYNDSYHKGIESTPNEPNEYKIKKIYERKFTL